MNAHWLAVLLLAVCTAFGKENFPPPTQVDSDGFPEMFSLRRDILKTYLSDQTVSGFINAFGPAVVEIPGHQKSASAKGNNGEEILSTLANQRLFFRIVDPAHNYVDIYAALHGENNEVFFEGSTRIRPKQTEKGSWVIAIQDIDFDLFMTGGPKSLRLPPKIDVIHVFSKAKNGNIIYDKWIYKESEGKFRISPSNLPQTGTVVLIHNLPSGGSESKGYNINTGKSLEETEGTTNYPMGINGMRHYEDYDTGPEDIYIGVSAHTWEDSPTISVTLKGRRRLHVYAFAIDGDNHVVEEAIAARIRLAGSLEQLTEFENPVPTIPEKALNAAVFERDQGKYYFVFDWGTAFKPIPEQIEGKGF